MLSNEHLEKLNSPGHNPFARHMGIVFEHVEPDHARAHLDVRDEMFHPGGIVHGGVAFSLVDTCMAHAVIAGLERGQNCSTVELKISYLAAVTEGRLTGQATVIRRGRRICFLEGRVDQGDRRIATATGTFAIIGTPAE